MRKIGYFFLGVFSILFLLGGVSTIVKTPTIGFFSIVGAAILWPPIAKFISAKLNNSWQAPVAGFVCALLIGPLLQGFETSGINKSVLAENPNMSNALVAGYSNEEKQREAQEWWQNRQNNLQVEQAKAARERESRVQLELKKHRQCSDNTMAYIMSQRFVKRELKAPGTSKFPSFHAAEVSVRNLGTCKFKVSSYVDAENSFGVLLRTYYTIDMDYSPAEKSWKGFNLTM